MERRGPVGTPAAPDSLPNLLLALATVAGAWLTLPTLVALTFASVCYKAP